MDEGIKRAFAAASISMLPSQIERALKRGQGTQLTSAQVSAVHELIVQARKKASEEANG